MFFKQIWRNAAKNRKGNGLFFGSLVIAIIAFYTLLSLGEQDVMIFLGSIESDAVSKLMNLLPVVYGVSLFFMFFLVYFACRYQTDSRKRELGMYLMLGMRRRRLFFMLFCETLWSSMTSLLIGIPVALLLTEGISLATARVVGLGIIGHHFTLSGTAIFWTICGFVLIQLLAMVIICIRLGRKEPADFLRSDAPEQQITVSDKQSGASFVLGIILLLIAYYLGIFQMNSLMGVVVLAVIGCGITGTFLLYRGLGGFLGKRIRRVRQKSVGLETFTARQVQESVLSQHKALAIASLLLLMALSGISYGISMGIGRGGNSRSADFSLVGEKEPIDVFLQRPDVEEFVKDSYPLYLSLIKEEYWEGEEKALDLAGLRRALSLVEGTENILENLHLEYVIAQSSYNRILKNMGEKPGNLKNNEVAIYTSLAGEGDFGILLSQVLKKGASVGINGKEYTVSPELYYQNVVADREITLYMAMVVPDELFKELARSADPYCYNIHLTDEATEEMGLMQAIQKMDEKIAPLGIEYDSYLAGIGRNLFYAVSASYLTLYLGILFLLIANTVIGLKFLIGQRQTKHRYVTLAMLGADGEAMGRSVKKQIRTFFLMVLSVAAVNSAAAVISMFTSITKLPVGTSVGKVMGLAGAVLILFILTEIIYIGVVNKAASHEVRELEITDRG